MFDQSCGSHFTKQKTNLKHMLLTKWLQEQNGTVNLRRVIDNKCYGVIPFFLTAGKNL